MLGQAPRTHTCTHTHLHTHTHTGTQPGQVMRCGPPQVWYSTVCRLAELSCLAGWLPASHPCSLSLSHTRSSPVAFRNLPKALLKSRLPFDDTLRQHDQRPSCYVRECRRKLCRLPLLQFFREIYANYSLATFLNVRCQFIGRMHNISSGVCGYRTRYLKDVYCKTTSRRHNEQSLRSLNNSLHIAPANSRLVS